MWVIFEIPFLTVEPNNGKATPHGRSENPHPHKLIDICFNIYNYNYRVVRAWSGATGVVALLLLFAL